MVLQSLHSDQRGESTGLLVGLIVMSVLFLGVAGFAVWAFMGRQDYKDNVDQKIAVANQVAVRAEDSKKDAQFAEELKNPLKIYNGPADYGSVSLAYPKTWNAYVSESSGTALVNGYFLPGFIPDLSDDTPFALRLQITNKDYSSVLKQYATYVQRGAVSSVPYKLPKLPKVIGVKIAGHLSGNPADTETGTMIILPLRDKTIQLWTESPNYEHDFETYILPNFNFSP